MKYILIFCFISFFSLDGSAQTKKISIENVVITDSSGMVYPTDIVQRLLVTGKFVIKWKVPLQTGILVALSEEQILANENRMAKPRQSNFFVNGKKISYFSEKDMYGNKINVKELVAAGKVVVLNFWFVNCPPCRMEMPSLNELVEKYKDNNEVVFISIALDDKFQIEQFLKSNPFHYQIIDNGRYIASQYGINSYPTHVVLSKEGKVIFHTTGLASNTVTWVKKSIEASLHNTIPE